MMPDTRPQIADLVEKLSFKSDTQNLAILQRLTNLFLEKCDVFKEEHVAIFDDIICALIERAPSEVLAELSAQLALIDNAPANVVSHLANHEDIAVAGPLLERSDRLTDDTLFDIAKDKSERHRTAIASRKLLSEKITDMLVQHGHAAVAHKITTNPNAHFSELGFVKLISNAKTDKDLAEALAARTDIPPELQPFLKLALAS